MVMAVWEFWEFGHLCIMGVWYRRGHGVWKLGAFGSWKLGAFGIWELWILGVCEYGGFASLGVGAIMGVRVCRS